MKPKRSRSPARAGAVACSLLLAGCFGGPDYGDLQAFMDEVNARPKGAVEPLPEIVTYTPFAYGASALRNPFEPPIPVRPAVGPGSREVKPPEHAKEYLEGFALGDLSMVGTIARPGEFFALVREPDGGVHRVRPGMFMGQNYGRITRVSDSEIELLEVVPDGVGGWVERNRLVRLGDTVASVP
jgi:type IV pilus assembly protein PilP